MSAVPVLLRRLIGEAGVQGLDVSQPIRQKQSQLLHEPSLKLAIQLARRQEDCGAILVLFEAEDDCPKTLGPRLRSWAVQESSPYPCAIALAHREYEAWFLAAIESLRGKRGIRMDAEPPPEPEKIRGAKEALEERMGAGCAYVETIDQAALTAQFDLKQAYRLSRSFRHLVKVFGDLVNSMGLTTGVWPPPDWTVP